MTRNTRILAVLLATGCAGLLVYSNMPVHRDKDRGGHRASIDPASMDQASMDPAAADDTARGQRPPAGAVAGVAGSNPAAPAAGEVDPAAPAEVVSAEKVALLIREATGDNPGARASAIDALAAAPESEAVPVLQRVLASGGDVDRQLALSSLHALALRQGDAEGGIRETLRQAIYDGGDEAVASGAQTALEDIERDAMKTR